MNRRLVLLFRIKLHRLLLGLMSKSKPNPRENPKRLHLARRLRLLHTPRPNPQEEPEWCHLHVLHLSLFLDLTPKIKMQPWQKLKRCHLLNP